MRVRVVSLEPFGTDLRVHNVNSRESLANPIQHRELSRSLPYIGPSVRRWAGSCRGLR